MSMGSPYQVCYLLQNNIQNVYYLCSELVLMYSLYFLYGEMGKVVIWK